jgi:hypothetical protein
VHTVGEPVQVAPLAQMSVGLQGCPTGTVATHVPPHVGVGNVLGTEQNPAFVQS